MTTDFEVIIVGAGAAGLFAGLAAVGALHEDGRFEPVDTRRRILLCDSKKKVGLKILASGGGRCNVTNARVRPEDFDTRTTRTVKGLLKQLPPGAVRRFFEDRGVPLVEEPQGKLFPASGKARQVVDCLLEAVADAGIETRFGTPVTDVGPTDEGEWRVEPGGLRARRVIVASGGLSLPKTGSTGFGFPLAERLGHTLVPTMPALTPLSADVPEGLSGITVPVLLSLEGRERGRVMHRVAGSLLFTHWGVSGPAALDASLWVERHQVRVRADFLATREVLDPEHPAGACLPQRYLPRPTPISWLREQLAAAPPSQTPAQFAARFVPRRLAQWLAPTDTTLAHLSRSDRKQLFANLTALDLRVSGTRGYRRAEVTAGGVDLSELHHHTLESSLHPGLHLCGEVCDATGRLGGFNFQWAWASGFAAGRGTLGEDDRDRFEPQ